MTGPIDRQTDICQKLESMNQKICVGNTRYFYFKNEGKEDTFIVLCQLHNINQEKIHKYMFILLLHDSNGYIFCGCFMSEFCLFFTISLTPEYLEAWYLTICFTICKATITRESDLGALRTTGLIPIDLF